MTRPAVLLILFSLLLALVACGGGNAEGDGVAAPAADRGDTE